MISRKIWLAEKFFIFFLNFIFWKYLKPSAMLLLYDHCTNNMYFLWCLPILQFFFSKRTFLMQNNAMPGWCSIYTFYRFSSIFWMWRHCDQSLKIDVDQNCSRNSAQMSLLWFYLLKSFRTPTSFLLLDHSERVNFLFMNVI